MDEVRAIPLRRGRLLLVAALSLAFLALLIPGLREHLLTRAPLGFPPSASDSNPLLPLSPSEQARRAAIAALGPIKKRPGVNAADDYKKALGLYNQLSRDEKSRLRDWRALGNPKSAAALYAKIQPIMDLLRRARKADYADWGLGPVELRKAMPELQAIQVLSQTALWESNYRFQTDSDGAVSDLSAMEAMSSSVVEDLIGFLVETGAHAAGIQVLAQNAGSITPGAFTDLAYIMNPAAVQESFQIGMNSEASLQQRDLSTYSDPATRNASELQMLVNSGIAPDQVKSEVNWMIQTEQALGSTLQEPGAQFQQWWAQVQAQSASMSALVVNPLSTLVSIRAKAQQSLAQASLLSAGLGMLHPDWPQAPSVTGLPKPDNMAITQGETQFKLVSSVGGKSISLTFPNPVAK